MPASINEVRNTVLAIANKNNYGYISPQDFNLYAQQAQLDIFEDYFYSYNNWVNKQNQRLSGTGYADIIKGLEEVIDSFSVQLVLTQNNANVYDLPLDYYLVNKLFYYPDILFTGTATATSANQLVDAAAVGWTTIPAGSPTPRIGSIVFNTTTLNNAFITGVVNTTTVNLSANIMTIGDTYNIYSHTNIKEVERVSQNKIFYLTNSQLTAPTQSYPAYVLDGNSVTIYPSTILNAGDIHIQYARYPLAPAWTWNTLVGGEPIFDATQPGFQEFELPEADEPALIAKICQYVGIEIREPDVYKFGQQDEVTDNQETN
tara:strand:- start:647 stop:1597 length:951 start_codon:yes stop_codon:yes gene_type:complete